jgi:hypothetical protein
MPKKKRPIRPRQQPESAPESIAKVKKRRRRRKRVAEPEPLVTEVRGVMHRIFENQREQLFQLREDIQKVIFLGW